MQHLRPHGRLAFLQPMLNVDQMPWIRGVVRELPTATQQATLFRAPRLVVPTLPQSHSTIIVVSHGASKCRPSATALGVRLDEATANSSLCLALPFFVSARLSLQTQLLRCVSPMAFVLTSQRTSYLRQSASNRDVTNMFCRAFARRLTRLKAAGREEL